MSNTEAIQSHIKNLGFKAKDKVTGFKGVITSLNFDLYGCIQYLLSPATDKDGKQPDSGWFDVTRLEITNKSPVMEQPNFDAGHIAEGKKGSNEKPLP